MILALVSFSSKFDKIKCDEEFTGMNGRFKDTGRQPYEGDVNDVKESTFCREVASDVNDSTEHCRQRVDRGIAMA